MIQQPHFGELLKRLEISILEPYQYSCVHIIHNSQDVEPSYMHINRWVDKLWCMHKMEYYSVFKRDEILQYVTIWVKLEDMALNEISQLQKDK